MQVKVEVQETAGKKTFQGTMEIASDHLLHDFPGLCDKDGNGIKTGVKARSDRRDHFQLLFARSGKEWVSFEFSSLEIGKEKIALVGKSTATWKFTKSPWKVSVTKIED